jgi:hypothetical protein
LKKLRAASHGREAKTASFLSVLRAVTTLAGNLARLKNATMAFFNRLFHLL